jgi:hypothetical protein
MLTTPIDIKPQDIANPAMAELFVIQTGRVSNDGNLISFANLSAKTRNYYLNVYNRKVENHLSESLVANCLLGDAGAFENLSYEDQRRDAAALLEEIVTQHSPTTARGTATLFYELLDIAAKLGNREITVRSDFSLAFAGGRTPLHLKKLVDALKAWFQPAFPDGTPPMMNYHHPWKTGIVFTITTFRPGYLTRYELASLKSKLRDFILAHQQALGYDTDRKLRHVLRKFGLDVVETAALPTSMPKSSKPDEDTRIDWQPTGEPDAWYARATHGGRFVIEARRNGQGLLEAFVYAPTITAYVADGRIKGKVEPACPLYSYLLPEDLPAENDARLDAILAVFDELVALTEASTARGTIEELKVLLRAVSTASAIELNVEVASAKTPEIKLRVQKKRISKAAREAIISAIKWFAPEGGRPENKDGRIQRTGKQFLHFAPQAATGHDLIEAGAQVFEFLTTKDLGLKKTTITAACRNLGI